MERSVQECLMLNVYMNAECAYTEKLWQIENLLER